MKDFLFTYKGFPLIQEFPYKGFPLQGVSPYTGFPLLRDFHFIDFLYKELQFVKDFSLYVIFLYK